MGYAAVVLVALTGVVNSVFLVGGFKALLSTPYGKLLIVKVALFATMVGLAEPLSADAPPARRGVGDSAAASTVSLGCRRTGAGLGDPAVVAVLGTWEPAIHLTVKM
jgi:copper resistance protein D